MPLFRGDIVAVPYPYSDLSGTKTRPALIVSTDAYNSSCPDVLVAAITTQLSRATSFDHVLADWRAAGLRYPSAVKGRVVTLAQTLVLRSVGRLSPGDQSTYDDKLLMALSTEASLCEALLRRQSWAGIAGDRLQALAESILQVCIIVAPHDSRVDLGRLRHLLPGTP